MDRELSAGYLQKARVARLGQREVALLELRIPGETRHVVLAEGLGVGLLDGTQRTRLKELLTGAAKPGEVRGHALVEEAARGLEGLAREELERAGGRIVDELARGEAGARRDA